MNDQQVPQDPAPGPTQSDHTKPDPKLSQSDKPTPRPKHPPFISIMESYLGKSEKEQKEEEKKK